MLLTLEILIAKYACHQEMQLKTLFLFLVMHVNCKTRELSVTYSPILYSNFDGCNTPSSGWQRHPRDSQLWTNAKPLHEIQQMKLLQW